MKVKIGFFMYNTSPLFEITTAKYLAQTKHDTYIVGENDNIISAENVNICTDVIMTKDLCDELDALVVTGGDIRNIKNMSMLSEVINDLYKNNKIVASICSGNDVLLNALDINTDDEIHGVKTVDNYVLCASADAYTLFGVYLGSLLDIYEDNDDFYETIQFFC